MVIPAPPSPPSGGGSADGSLPGMEHGSGTPMLGGARGRGSYNPYGLPLGTEYYVATIAMVPDL